MKTYRRRLRFEALEDRRMLAALFVNSAADNIISGDGLVTLREAILAANNDHFTDLGQSGFGADTILFSRFVFDVPIPKKITLTIPIPFEITEALTIDATALANNVIIDANNATRIFSITATTSNVTLAGLTLTGGNIAAGGGAVRSLMAGTLTIEQSTVSGNRTTGASSRGGAISSRGDVTLTNSTVSGNSTTGSSADGGGIWSYRAVTLTGSTVTNNHANSSNSKGGGIRNVEDPITITNSIVAGNTAGGGNPDIRPGAGALNIDFSLIEQTGLTFTGGNNIVGFPANLGPLSGNGGPTKTHALLAGSPAIDRGDPSIAFNPNEFDQRGDGFIRVANGDPIPGARLDIGSYESQGVSSFLLGDYNLNGTVDAADYTVWLNTLGSTTNLDADGSGNNVVDQADYGIWKANFGNSSVTANAEVGSGSAESSVETRRVGAAPATQIALPTKVGAAPTLRFDIAAARSSAVVRDDLLLLAIDRAERSNRDELTSNPIAERDDSRDIRGLDSDPLAIALAEWL